MQRRRWYNTKGELTEEGFQTKLIHWARKHGWLVHHTRHAKIREGRYITPIQGDVGFPDLVLVKDGRVVFAELKVGRNRPSSDQIRWGEALKQTPAEYYLWRPEDWDQILQILQLEPIDLVARLR